MTVKDAATNSLLMFVAATCVVLIVRATGTPAPGTTVDSAAGSPVSAMHNGVKVYYLHSNVRCTTCRTIQAYAKEAVEAGFPDELRTGQVVWEVVNYETPGNEHYATDYDVAAPNVVLVKFQDGRQIDWKGLPEVWEYTEDKTAFVDFVQTSLRDFMDGKKADPSSSADPHPTPDAASEAAPLPDLPLPE